MIRLLKEELWGIWQFLKRHGKETIIIAFATLFQVLHEYHPIQNEWLSVFLYYGVFPILVIIIILRKNPLDFGLRRGSPRIWGIHVIVICAIAAAILYASSFSTELQAYYQKADFSLLNYFLLNCVSLSAQEFMYRGFLLFGLMEKLKEGSILLQTIPFVLMHLGKPELETVSTIITGLLFGYVAYRGKSFWPAFIIHLFINVFFVGVINLRAG
ncbi:MAG: CPBP family intramembrane metalloprotease [Dehalococcoidales bacterium]|nr:CPBP family intramembrane metalloprotease [Dehalococcoidales bacterium]